MHSKSPKGRDFVGHGTNYTKNKSEDTSLQVGTIKDL